VVGPNRARRAPRVLVAGSANLDIVISVCRLPVPGETVLGDGYQESWGGKGANQALAALKAGADVRLVVATGRDYHGAAYRKYLTERGIQRRGFFTVPAPTGTALVVVDKKGRNQIAVSPGANALLTSRRLNEKKGVLEFGEVVLAQFEIPLSSVEAAFRSARRRGAITILNPAPVPRGELTRVFSLVDIIVPNETEAIVLAGKVSPRGEVGLLRVCRAIREKGAKFVVMTAGERGALALGEGWSVWVRPPSGIRSTDTTGAGDAFSGALAASLAGGSSMLDAVRFAVAAGSLSTRKRGAQDGLPGRRAISVAAKRTVLEVISRG